jgi:hypothetical protein
VFRQKSNRYEFKKFGGIFEADGDVLQFHHFVRREELVVPSLVYKCVAYGLQPMFPNIELILKIFLTILLSNASGGRSLSALKR